MPSEMRFFCELMSVVLVKWPQKRLAQTIGHPESFRDERLAAANVILRI